MINRKMKYALDDVFIEPSVTSDITSRSECNPYHTDGMLPLFTAPMSSVIDENNYQTYIDNNINPILPRTVGLDIRLEKCTNVFCAFSLSEFESIFVDNPQQFDNIGNGVRLKVLVDIANGHMEKLHNLITRAKEKFGKQIIIMAGNVANPETYTVLSNAGADYVRVGIGSGSVCFLPGTKIKTETGEKNIEDVVVGDKVKTHKNAYKEVTNKMSVKNHKYKKFKINNEVCCTENHEFYVLNKKYKDIIDDDNIHEYAEWVEVGAIDKNKYFLIKLE